MISWLHVHAYESVLFFIDLGWFSKVSIAKTMLRIDFPGYFIVQELKMLRRNLIIPLQLSPSALFHISLPLLSHLFEQSVRTANIHPRPRKRLTHPQRPLKRPSRPTRFFEILAVVRSTPRPGRDRKAGVYARQDVAQVPLICTRLHVRVPVERRDGWFGSRGHWIGKGVEVAGVGGGEDVVGHVVCVSGGGFESETGAGGFRAGTQTCFDFALEFGQPSGTGCSDDEAAGCVGVDHVGCCAAVGDVHSHDIVGAELLSEHAHGVVCDDERIQCVDTQPGIVCCMRRFSKVLCFESCKSCGAHECAVVRKTWMRNQGDVHMIISTYFEQQDFAAFRRRVFFAGGAYKMYSTW